MAQAGGLYPRRSFTRNHDLLPASRPGTTGYASTYDSAVPRLPAYSLISWTFGRGSVIWRIWPAVLLHTTFAAVIVTLSMKEIVHLDIPSVMLTVLGVVIGFVISYRASSGYDRYWLGRTCWSDVIRNARTMGRLIWFHVPPRLSGKTPEEMASGKIERSSQELLKVMAEKRVALDLVKGFAVALKHHIRGELGIYYEDLYHLIRPLHEHEHTEDKAIAEATTSALAQSPRKAHRISMQPPMPQAQSASASRNVSYTAPAPSTEDADPIIPPINAYGTFGPNNLKASLRHHLKRSKSQSSSLSSSSDSSHHVLLPSTLPDDDTMMAKVSSELIPFSGIAGMIRRYFSTQQPLEVLPPNLSAVEQESNLHHHHHWQGPIMTGAHAKHRPKVAGGGENLPLEVLRCLSEWLSVLEDRGTVPGTSMGPMVATVAAFEESLTTLERILTTPLPFVYSVHISTVWLYLFFLPFQLVTLFGYYTIPGVAIAAFIYLGFLAAGEEIEQPFGYDDNDLDLDLFCHEIVHADIEHLKKSPCLNAYLGPTRPTPVHRQSMTVVEVSSQYDHGNDESFDVS
ncbi:Bestrophin, RFP-TM, chloride channel-domain-containing protein [Lyophyllum atratum]|nr:Bestrophin, RFP-TM, chloride channel-domain-containing protein [Lyophyllum atratum]